MRFANDQVMVANSESGLQRIMSALANTGKLYDIKINIKKTKIMRISSNSVVATFYSMARNHFWEARMLQASTHAEVVLQ